MNLRAFLSVSLLMLCCCSSTAIAEGMGLPFFQTYSYQEIGDLSPGARISYDLSGMIWVSHQGTLLRFDNKNWIDMIDPSDSARNINHIEISPDGTIYYGAPGDWGELVLSEQGKLLTKSYRKANTPGWCQNNRIEFIVFTESAVSFTGQNGTIYYDKTTGENHFFELHNTRTVFSINDELYLSAFRGGIRKINLQNDRLERIAKSEYHEIFFEATTAWSDEEILAVTSDGRIVFFDGEQSRDWNIPVPAHHVFQNVQLLKMKDGRIAFSHQTEGLFILNADGSLFRSYTDPTFRAISDIEMMEPGVIWFSSTRGITKLMYDYPVSVFDHRSEVSLIWPKLISRNGKTYLINVGTLYEFEQNQAGKPAALKKWKNEISFYAATAEATDNGFLVGNNMGLFEFTESGQEIPVLANVPVELVTKIDEDKHRYLVFAGAEIIGVEQKSGQWREFAPRVPGIGFPSVTHRTQANSFWIELGVNRVAHVLVEDDQIRTEVIDDWDKESQPSWITIGGIETTTVLIKNETDFRFYNETSKQFEPNPKLRELLQTAPFAPQRPNQTENGTIWMGHANGVFLAYKDGDHYEFDTDSLRLLRFNHPILKVMNGSVWVTGEQIMYRIDGSIDSQHPHNARPRLVSINDTSDNTCLYSSDTNQPVAHFSRPYHANSLSFHFFPGSYATLRSPSFQYRLTGYFEEWSPPSQGPIIDLANLHEGNYTLEVRMLTDGSVFGAPTSLTFTIDPPVHRTWYAYLCYLLLGLLIILSIVRWYSRRIQERARRLEKLVEQGTSELRDANQSLISAINKAESASKEKSLFLANMSHEIRTPLNGSLGMCELLAHTKMTKEQMDMLQTMRTSNEQLLIIINDILDFSKIEAGEIQFEEVNFNLFSILDEVLDLNTGTLHSKPIELTYAIADEVPKNWMGDPYRIRQILLNLVSNAIKFTPEGSIHIRVELSQADKDLLKFSVQDSGIGVSDVQQQELFKPFSQADESTTRHYGGTGLGLSISQKLTTLMGGEIWIAPKTDRGSCFCFTLNLKKTSPSEGFENHNDAPLCWPYQHCFVCCKSEPLSEQIQHYLQHYKTWYTCTQTLKDLEKLLANHGTSETPILLIVDELVASSDECSEQDVERIEQCSKKLGAHDSVIVLRTPKHFSLRDPFKSKQISCIQKPLRLYQLIREIETMCTSPLCTPAAELEKQTELSGSSLAANKPKILLVEDNVVNQKVATLMLRQLQFECDVARDGEEAIQLFENHRHDIILMDIQMPGMDGIETTRHIFEACQGDNVPIVFAMSAGVMPEQRVLCKSIGMRGFIPKPVSLEFLEEKLKPHLHELI